MLKSGAATAPDEAGGWRERRRQSARDAIIDAAWEAVRSEGLAALSIRDLAKRAGVTTPTIYAYFESKHAIYDAMFGRAAAQFADWMDEPYEHDDPREVLVAGARRFMEFCMSEPARYQLLFQRTIPGFEPSAASYAPAVRALEGARQRLAANGITDPRHLDLWTALTSGLVAQQLANDAGGTRWSRLVDEAVEMFLQHTEPTRAPRRAHKPKGARRGHQG